MPVIQNLDSAGDTPNVKVGSSGLNQILSRLEDSKFIDLYFLNDEGKAILTRDVIELALEQVSIQYNGDQYLSKVYPNFIKMDTDIDKQMKEYKANVKALIATAVQMINANKEMSKEQDKVATEEPDLSETPEENSEETSEESEPPIQEPS